MWAQPFQSKQLLPWGGRSLNRLEMVLCLLPEGTVVSEMQEEDLMQSVELLLRGLLC